jgi:hypothetical protein
MSDIQPTEEHDKLVRLYLSMGFPYTRATDLACEIGTYRKRITELEAESLDYKAKWLDARHNHKVVSENRDAAIAEAKREAQPARCERHKYVVPSLNSICEICDHEEAVAYAVSRTKDKCADAAERALQAAPDYESMHTMVRAAIMQVGNAEVSGSESAAPTVRTATATKP